MHKLTDWKSSIPPTPAERQQWASAIAPSESAGPAKVVAAGATGCLPGLVAEILSGFEIAMARAKTERDSRKYDDSVRHYMNGRVDAFYYAIAQTKLIQRLVCANERQPEDKKSSAACGRVAPDVERT